MKDITFSSKQSSDTASSSYKAAAFKQPRMVSKHCNLSVTRKCTLLYKTKPEVNHPNLFCIIEKCFLGNEIIIVITSLQFQNVTHITTCSHCLSWTSAWQVTNGHEQTSDLVPNHTWKTMSHYALGHKTQLQINWYSRIYCRNCGHYAFSNNSSICQMKFSSHNKKIYSLTSLWPVNEVYRSIGKLWKFTAIWHYLRNKEVSTKATWSFQITKVSSRLFTHVTFKSLTFCVLSPLHFYLIHLDMIRLHH